MAERVHLRPARAGLLVPDPDHGGLVLPPEGRTVPLSTYWQRRLQDGDVLEGEPPRAEAPRPRPEKPPK